MKCSRIVALVPLHVGGDLDETLGAAVERHLATCEACAAEFAACESSRQSLFALKGEVPSEAPDLWPSVRLRAGPPPRARRRFPLRAAAAVLLAAAGTYAVVSNLPGERVDAPTVTPPTAEVPPADVGEEYMLAEVGPSDVGPEHDYDAGELPFVVPAEPERTGWDEF